MSSARKPGSSTGAGRGSQVASWGVDVSAGQGFITESDVQRHHLRDSRQLLLGPITNEIARNAPGGSLGLCRSY
jgi:alkylation response protein AidB-like acyl-CoA dehydrogenase